MNITNTGPALDDANRTVRDTCARLLRLLRDPNRTTEKVYALQDSLGSAVHLLTTTLVATLTGMGYKAYSYSDSHYFMLDECVYLELGKVDLGMWYELVVWSYSKPRPRVQIVGGWYDEVLPSLAAYEGAGIRLGTMGELIDCLGGITATINAYSHCVGCHYSSGDNNCGLGKLPPEVCTDRQLITTGL
jgi:hypothetical protein